MPVATIKLDHEKFPLKTLEGGEVTLRRLPYGQWLKRQEMALQMKLTAQKGSETTGVLDMANRKVTEFEFGQCIVDHNLTNEDGTPLNFNDARTFDILDARIGNEIASYITQMHEFEDGLGNL